MESSCSWSTSSVVRGHHNVWTPSIGEQLQLRRQDDNDYDNHAVSTMKAETIVGHVPREMSRTFWHFIRHGGCMVGASDAHGHVSSLENRGGTDKQGGAHSRYQLF